MSESHPPTEPELIDFVRSIDVQAPDRLHRQVEALVGQRAKHGRRRRLAAGSSGAPAPVRRRAAGALALAAALAVAVALVASLTGGSTALSVRAASALTLRPATMAAPVESPGNRAQLAAAVDGVAFPYWEERFGWRATGARTDRVGGRQVRTVFYANGRGERIGYAIVAGAPAPKTGGGELLWRGGTRYRLLVENGSQVVTWLRGGHLCVVSGRGVARGTLLALASWDDRGGIAS
jgi:hypothetical protein